VAASRIDGVAAKVREAPLKNVWFWTKGLLPLLIFVCAFALGHMISPSWSWFDDLFVLLIGIVVLFLLGRRGLRQQQQPGSRAPTVSPARPERPTVHSRNRPR